MSRRAVPKANPVVRSTQGSRVSQRSHRATVAVCTLFASILPLVPGPAAEAAELRWTGLGLSALSSDAANWDALRVPDNGDGLLFSGTAARLETLFDQTRTFASLSFAVDAQAFSLHVQGNGATLAFGGPGIRNGSIATSTFTQDLYADAGSAGGSIVFTGLGGINRDATANLRPVNLVARGGSTAPSVGGQIVFQDQSATGTNTYDGLRADGASAAGGAGGSIVFRDQALATRSSGIAIFGGSVLGAAGAQASFEGQARVEGSLSVFAGSDGGYGARAVFSGTAVAAASTGIAIAGAESAAAGAEGVVRFAADARMAGSATNNPGTGAGFSGGRLEFGGRAGHDSSSNDPRLGMAQIANYGAAVAGARGGATVFMDDAFVRGSGLIITNFVAGESGVTGTVGGTTEFRDRSRAGQVTLVNQGALVAGAGTVGGATLFSGQASAEAADITSYGSGTSGAPGGSLRFEGASTADGATLRNDGARVSGAGSGVTAFGGNASAGHASIVNAPGEVSGTAGGNTLFSGNAVAGSAYLSNNTRPGMGGGGGGYTAFAGASSAQYATIDNHGGLSTGDNGSTGFRDRADAGQAAIVNFGGRAAAAFGGITSFSGTASAGAATLVMAGGAVDQALGGFAVFYDDTRAGSAALDLRAASVPGASGGRVVFYDRASAADARFTVAGSSIDNVLGPEAAGVTFTNASSAGNASFTIGGNRYAGGGAGTLRFEGASTAAGASIALLTGQTHGGALRFEGAGASDLASAGNARITNQGASAGIGPAFAVGGQTTFLAYSSAGSATITNQAGLAGGRTDFFGASTAGDARFVNLGGGATEVGGFTQLSNSASAQRATIVNSAGMRGANGFDAAGATGFVNQASAGQARITAQGAASASHVGGLISFAENADPATATLIAEGGTQGGTGGRIRFAGLTNASQARVILNAGDGPDAGGEFDISAVSVAGVAIGSVEGGGIVSLGARNLTVWSPSANTRFSGVLRDGGVAMGTGGSLSVTGGATLTLMGASTYSGVTRIGDGLHAGSGKLIAANALGSATGSGDVFVERGGTLAGSGSVAGHVNLMDGGVIAPGDPVTLGLDGGLTWNGGGVIRLVLGADAAGSDHVVMHNLVRGTDGAFVFDLVDFGMTAGASYDLLQYDSISGFDASDFSFRGLDGTFALQGGRLEFITSAVPEPGAALLWLPGLLLVLGSAAARPPVASVQAASRYIAWRPRPRAAICPTAAPIAPMCSGVVPQQPPTMFTSPCSANSLSRREVTSGVSSKPVSDIGLGKPAFG